MAEEVVGYADGGILREEKGIPILLDCQHPHRPDSPRSYEIRDGQARVTQNSGELLSLFALPALHGSQLPTGSSRRTW